MKREIRTRLDLLKPDVSAWVLDKQAQQKETHDQHAKAREFIVGESVSAKHFHPGPDWLPATVIAKLGPLSYLGETADQQLWRCHIDHLKSRLVRCDTAVPLEVREDSYLPDEPTPRATVGSTNGSPVSGTEGSQPASPTPATPITIEAQDTTTSFSTDPVSVTLSPTPTRALPVPIPHFLSLDVWIVRAHV